MKNACKTLLVASGEAVVLACLLVSNTQAYELNADEKIRAERITTIFENGAPDFQYAYIENLGDGRGYTAGRVGFCTGTGDLVQVVALYVRQEPGNLLAPYLTTLQLLAQQGSDSMQGLDGFPQAWATAAQDPVFRWAQDAITDQLYYDPAMKIADEANVQLPMGKEIFYDTAIMHGYSANDPDSLMAFINTTRIEYCTSFPNARPTCLPTNPQEEYFWLRIFLSVRKADMLNPHNHATQVEWAQNAERPDDLATLLDQFRGQIPPANATINNMYYDGPLGG